uniref:YadA-like family protein n=1 Tax=Phascolarctobacterium succinatutens TaxID=626940 RepID=UPI003AEFCAF6
SNPIFGATAKLTNGKASVELRDSTTIINGKVQVRQDGSIGGVTAGRVDNDAVNLGQLKDVKAEAGKHTTLVAGDNVQVKEEKTDNGLKYTVSATDTTYTAGNGIAINGENNAISVKLKAGEGNLVVDKDGLALNKDLQGIASISNGGASLTLGAMGGMVSEFANGQGASVKLFGDTTTINGKVNVYKDGRIAGVADGVNANDAVNVSQLQKAAAASATTVSDGVNTTVTATKAEDGHTDYKVNLNKDLVGIESISNAGASLTMNGIATELANGQGASVKLFGDTTTINNAVTVYKDGRISGVADGINNNDAVNVGQLNKVSEIANKGWNLATNGVASEATNVKPGDYVDFSGDKNISVSHDGTKVKVELNKDLDVNSVQTNALNAKYNLSVGTMAENGIMPFFVNSTGAFYAAHNKFSVDKDGNMNANSVQTNALNSKYNLSVGTANENGTVPFFVNSNGAFYAANGKLVVDKDGKVTATAGEIGNVVLNNGVFTGNSALRDGELFVGDASGNYSQITTKGAKLGKVTIAEDGKISGVAAGEVSSTSTDAINGSQLHQTNENVAQNKADIAQNKADIAANRADIDKNKADIKNLDNRVTNVEELAKKHTTVTAGDNITVTEDTNKDGGKEYKVALDKDIKLDSVTTGQTVMNNDGLKVGDKVSVTKDAVTAGKTYISDEGVKVGDKTYISDKGLNANDQKVTNVAAGEISATSKDAVNGSQLYATNQEVVNNTNRINQLGSRVNKVGAGAAALAALHPMDFDPDDKLTFSAGYGNYGGENAAAIGAYYRPDEKVMFSVGGTVGNGENMVNAGVSFSLDRTNHVSNSRTAMAREILDLRAEVTELKAMVAKGGLGSIAEDKMKIFPDVAENHWAYEYVGKLAAAGIIEGYPDGKFSGDRMMSRYEFAAMLYRAMQKGAQLDSKIINEFAPEMGRIRVDRISGEDGDRDKIERVRVNAVKGERDHYGNKIAKAEAKAK